MPTPRPARVTLPRPRVSATARSRPSWPPRPAPIRPRRKRPFFYRPAGLSRYWRLVNDGQPRRNPPPPHLFDLWIMILAAKGLPYRLAGRGDRLRLYVPALLERLSRAELAAVEAENHSPAPQPEPPARRNAHWVLLLLLLLIFWHGVRMHWGLTEGLAPAISPEAWLERGAVDVFRVQRWHEWYRCVTALTLHADSEHLFGNVLFGAPFLLLLCRRVGLGPGLALVLLAGTLGNVFNVLYRPVTHVSLGFSTALFGTVGVLSGALALQGRRLASRHTDQRSWRQGILLLAAGAGILAMLGTEGPRTDYAAHLFGLLAGFGVGGAFSRLFARSGQPPLSRTVEVLLGFAAAGLLIGAWRLAL